MAEYATQFTAPGAVPTGILSTDQKLTQEQAEEYKNRWNTRAGGVAVLGQGTKYSPILVNPSDLQFLETRNFDTLQIARLFGIPPRLMGASIEGSSMTYSNLQDDDMSFIRWTVMAYLRPIEDALSWLLPREWSVRYNLDALLRPSTKTRYEAHKLGLEAGFLTIEEVRSIEGLDR